MVGINPIDTGCLIISAIFEFDLLYLISKQLNSMKRFFTISLFFLAVFSGQKVFALFGGPDAYGYTWKDSNEPGGPTYNWIDISTIGTQVTGLADDNSNPAGVTNIGFNFHYYWSDYNKIKIGSNGWLSFDNPSNIASCFPALPTGGGAENIVAAFMTDLTFIGAGNVATCHYWTNSIDSFIVQYTNVPYWNALAPGYNGLNSFQIILNGGDSSITFQYQDVSAVNDIAACNDFSVGIENLSGNIGLQCYLDMMPPTSYAIKFEYPDVPLIAVQDPTPFWNNNTSSGGVFVGAGTFNISSNIKNVGNANVVTPTNVTAQIRNLAFVLVYSDADTVASLNAGLSTTLNFNPVTLFTPGQYSYVVSTSNTSDLNPSNNQRISEIEVINACATTAMTYHTPNLPDQQVSWNAGTGGDDGIGVFYKPPVYPVVINSLDFYIQNALGDGYSAVIYANDAPFGAPGTILSTTNVVAGSVVTASWNTVTLASPVTIDSAGFYVVFYQAGPNIFLGLETAFPISRNTYEILDGVWSTYRENDEQDAAFRVNITPPGLDNTTSLAAGTISANQTGASYQWLDCGSSYAVVPGATSQNFTPTVNGSYAVQINYAGCVDTSACTLINNVGIEENILNNSSVYPNPAESAINIELNDLKDLENVAVLLTDISGKIITVSCRTNDHFIQVDIASLSNGVYTYSIINNEETYAVGKFIKQ